MFQKKSDRSYRSAFLEMYEKEENGDLQRIIEMLERHDSGDVYWSNVPTSRVYDQSSCDRVWYTFDLFMYTEKSNHGSLHCNKYSYT